MTATTRLIPEAARKVGRHWRYILWFYGLNLALALIGASDFRARVHGILDHSLYADKLLHGFDMMALAEMLSRPEMSSMGGALAPSMYSAIFFFVISLLLMPGVLKAYAGEGRLPLDEFFRACGRNGWRFVRLLLFFLLISVPLAGILFGVQGAIVNAADRSTNERLPFFLQLGGLAVIFLVMTFVRLWFDLAQADVVLRDQGAVRRSLAAGFRQAWRQPGRLLGSYVVINLLTILALFMGLWIWNAWVPSSSVLGAFLVGQGVLFLWLAARFWQRALAVTHCQAGACGAAPQCSRVSSTKEEIGI